MSRRTQRRKAGNRKSGIQWGKWMVRGGLAFLLIGVMAFFGVKSWLKNYLRSDDFRVFMSQKVSAAMGADAEFSLFEWQGLEADVDTFTSKNGKTVKSLQADSLSAKVSLDGVRRGVWEISDVRVKKVNMLIDTRNGSESQVGEKPTTAYSESHEQTPDEGGFLSKILPNKAELQSLQVQDFNFDLITSGGYLKWMNSGARIDLGATEGVYDLKLDSGRVESSWFKSPLRIRNVSGTWNEGTLFIRDAQAGVFKRGFVQMEGEIGKGNFALLGTLRDVSAEELVPTNWQSKIMGDVATRFRVDNMTGSARLRGRVALKNGRLTALPILDTIAAYANEQRFRSLVLSEASCLYTKEGERLQLDEIIIASEGLIRVEGSLIIVGKDLRGKFRVGITPGTLSHIPGAETKVFLRGEKGLLWAPLAISGTLDAPKEDLSQRMIEAAGERMFELIPETGQRVLKFAGTSAGNLPNVGANVVRDVIEGKPDKVIETGVGVIESGVSGLFGTLPGIGTVPSQQPENDQEEKNEKDEGEDTKKEDSDESP